MLFSPRTAKPMNELAEVLLLGPTACLRRAGDDRNLRLSTKRLLPLPDGSCAVAAQHWDGNEQLVQQTKLDFEGAPISEKLKALLTVAGKVQKGGKQVTTEGVAREQGRDRQGNS